MREPVDRLQLVFTGGQPAPVDLAPGKLVIGRGADADLRIDDPAISRRHAQLVVSHGHVTVSDLNSRHGTYVNSRRLGGAAPLRPGDELRIGDTRLRLVGPRRHEILILGGGFGGAYTAMALQKQLRRRRDVGVTLISRENFMLFQPMLPELVSGSIETPHILTPLRGLLPRVQVLCGEVLDIDFAAREVQVSTGLENRVYPIGFDSLVLALGAVTDLSKLPGLTEHALLAKSVGDAMGLRNHVLDMLEKADAEGDPEERERLLTFVVAGGGFSGVEIMAELCDLVYDALPHYPGIDPDEPRLVLLQSSGRILPEVGERLAEFARTHLERKGIEVWLNSGVAALTPDAVELRDGRQLPTRTLVATIGNRPHPLVELLPCERTERGAVKVDEYLRSSVPGIWALGDVAAVPDLQRGGTCPPTAQHAVRQASVLAHNLLAALDGRPLQPFRFGGLGQLASLGHHSAVAEVGGRQLSGWLAWWLWRGVYLAKLPTLERRLRVLGDWLLGTFLPRDTARLPLERSGSVLRAHYQAGQIILRQGDVGTRFFIIARGEVEIVREGPSGQQVALARLGPGEHFGELALLGGGRRNATVRAVTPVDLLAMERRDFLALATHGPLLREQLDRAVEQRAAAESPADAQEPATPAPSAGT